MLFFFSQGRREGRVGGQAIRAWAGGAGGVVCVLDKYCDLPFFGLPLERSQCNLMYC